MSSTEIKIQSYEDLKQYFHPERRSMIHCAVQRRPIWLPKYRHHYIVLGHTWSPEDGCQIIHYASHTTHSCVKGKVSLERYSNENIKNDIRAGLYVYEICKYPQSETEYSEAFTRFEKRNNETNFSIAFNNCEHLVYDILTGSPVSYQVKNATAITKWLIEIIDNRVEYLLQLLTFIYVRTYLWDVHVSLHGQLETMTLEIIKIDYLHKRKMWFTLELLFSFMERIGKHRATDKSNSNVVVSTLCWNLKYVRVRAECVTQPFINYLERRCEPSFLTAEDILKDLVRNVLSEHGLFVLWVPRLLFLGSKISTTYKECKSLDSSLQENRIAKRIVKAKKEEYKCYVSVTLFHKYRITFSLDTLVQ